MSLLTITAVFKMNTLYFRGRPTVNYKAADSKIIIIIINKRLNYWRVVEDIMTCWSMPPFTALYCEYATANITGCFQPDTKDLLLRFVIKLQKNVIYSNLSDSRYIFPFLFSVQLKTPKELDKNYCYLLFAKQRFLQNLICPSDF
jgi:hypothetical protein